MFRKIIRYKKTLFLSIVILFIYLYQESRPAIIFHTYYESGYLGKVSTLSGSIDKLYIRNHKVKYRLPHIWEWNEENEIAIFTRNYGKIIRKKKLDFWRLNIFLDENGYCIHHTLTPYFWYGFYHKMRFIKGVPNIRKNMWNNKKGNAPIRTRTKTFEELKEMAKEGIIKHWGRNIKPGITRYVKIAGERYQVYIRVMDDPIGGREGNHMREVELIFSTNRRDMYSRNPGAVIDDLSAIGNMFTGKVVYEIGYINKTKLWKVFKKSEKWEYYGESVANGEFGYTAAHEVGHEILQAFGGTAHSYQHKGSTTVLQTTKKDTPVLPGNMAFICSIKR